MRSSAKSLVLDLLSAAPQGELSVRGLVKAAALFDIAENSVRVALARLRSAELVESTERGVYTLGDAAGSLNRHVTSWREVERQCRKWDGGWIAVHTAGLGRSDRAALRRRERALRLLGFRELERGLEVRPDNLKGGIEAIRERLVELGLEGEAPVFRAKDFDPELSDRAMALWEADELVEIYRDMRTKLEAELDKNPDRDVDEAARESFLLGGAAIRQIVFDPLLPEPIVDTAERKAFVDAMRRFDRVGQTAWRRFLEAAGAFDVPGASDRRKMHSPADLSGVDREEAGVGAASKWSG